MTHVLLAAVMLVALAPGSSAEETVIRLHVDPRPEPTPALKYQLLPEVRELNPGNAAQNYLKCFMEQRAFFFSDEGTAQRIRYLAMPLAELAAAKVGGYGGNALRQADRAARMVAVDWQVIPEVRAGERQSPPAELGPLQVLALSINVRLRAEVAERHYDDAVRTAKTIFALGRHLGEYPSALATQVGMWVVHLGVGSLQEMVQQPGCPNLYWALSDLPSPLVDLRKGVQGDRTAVEAVLRPIRGDAAMTDAQIEACVSHVSGLIGFARERAGKPPRGLRSQMAARANDSEQLSIARRRLIEAGAAGDFVSSMPPMQVILLDEKLAYEIKRDARLKLLAVPIWKIKSAAHLDTRVSDEDGPFDELLPDVVTLRRTQAALDQEIALLHHVEALRLHAAGTSGQLPARLSEVSAPLPDDPFTGRPFDYSMEGTTAHLRGRSQENEGCSVRFEVTVRAIQGNRK